MTESAEDARPTRVYTGPWSAERNALIPEYKAAIVEGIRQGLWVSELATNLKINVGTIGHWREQDKTFDREYRDATEAFVDTLEREVHRRAFEGVTDVILYKGAVVMDPFVEPGEKPRPLLKRQFSDGLAMFVLKGRRREVYGDRVETDNRHTVNLDGARETLQAKLSALADRAAVAAVPRATEAGGEPDA